MAPRGMPVAFLATCSLLSILALLVSRAAAQANNSYQVHAGGSAQAGAFIRKAMSTMQARARAPIQATYREIGTVEGQTEFLAWGASVQYGNNFKVGDIPLSSDKYQQFTAVNPAKKMLHLPLAVGSISIFYNQQVPAFGLMLDACTVDGIYKGTITRWNDNTLSFYNNWGDLAANRTSSATDQEKAIAEGVASSLPYLNAPITAYYYAGDNSASSTLSTWVEKTCTGTTTNAGLNPYQGNTLLKTSYVKLDASGKNITVNIQTAEEMAEAINLTPNSIGFLATNIGVAMDLDEAQLENSQGGNVAAGDGQKFVSLTVQQHFGNAAPDFSAEDWTTMQFSGGLNEPVSFYPLTNLIYAYIAADLTPFGDSGPLTQALLTYMFSPEGQEVVAQTGLIPLPQVLLDAANAAVKALVVSGPAWPQEPADQPSPQGMQITSFSALRTSGTLDEISTLTTNMTRLQARVGTGVVVRAAGSAFGNSGPIFRSMMDDLSSYASYAVRFLYEDVSDNVPGMSQMLHPNDHDVQTRLLVLDQPLTSDQWIGTGAAGVQVLQHPLMIRPIALLYTTGANSSVPGADTIPNLNMRPCTLARILKGSITTWNDGSITNDNSGLNLPGNNIAVYAACNDAYCGTMNAILAYLQVGCPAEVATTDTLALFTAPITTTYRAADLAQVVVNGPPGTAAGTNVSYTALVFADADWAVEYAAFGLKEAALPAATSGGLNGNFVIASKVTPESFADLVTAKLGVDSETFTYPWSNWDKFNLSNTDYSSLPGTSYPLARLDFTAVPADLNELGDAGGALQGVLQYAYTYWQSSSSLASTFPAAAPLPANVYQWAQANLNTLTRISILSPPWPVVATSLAAPTGSRPYVMSYLPSGHTSTVDVAAFNQFKVSSLAAATAQLAVAKSALANDQANNSASLANYTYGVAIAALVLVLILAVAALVIALLALRDARRALTLMSGGAGKSYSFQVNSPSTNANAAAAVANTPSYPSSSTIVSPARAKANPLFGCLPGAAPQTKYEVFSDKPSHVGIEMDGAYHKAP